MFSISSQSSHPQSSVRLNSLFICPCLSHSQYHPLLPNSNPCPTPNGAVCRSVVWLVVLLFKLEKGGREGRKEQSSSDKRRHKLRSTRLLSSFFPPLAVAQHRHTTKLGRRVSGLVNSRKIQNQWISLVRM